MNELRVTTVQADLIWENRLDNLQKFDTLLQGIERSATDIIVLPEMFTTGFSMRPADLAEPMNDATLFWLKKKAWELDAAIVGSFICSENAHFYNRLVWMQPDGHFETYDKRHRFSFANEHAFYTEGARRLMVEWRGWRICPLICYDLRFPAWSRNAPATFGEAEYYDVLIYVANWARARRVAWQSLLTARAIENQAYVVGVNRVGTDGNGIEHTGDTTVVDFAGETLFRRTNTEGVDTTIFIRQKLYDFRKKFGFLEDQDAFEFIS